MKTIYLDYGNSPSNQYRTYYSLLTYINSNYDLDSEIILFTTNPEFYKKLKIKITIPDDKRVKQDMKKYNYPHFLKLDILKDINDSIMFFDSDTIITANLEKISKQIKEKNSFVFKKEYLLKQNPHYKKITDAIEILKNNKNDSTNQNLVKNKLLHKYSTIITPEMPMCNSGFIGIHKNDLKLIDESIELMKELFTIKWVHTAEQLALSAVLLKNTVVHESYPYMVHYWDDKEKYDLMIKRIVDKHKSE